MNDNKRSFKITIAILAAVLLAGILLLAFFMKPIPELSLDRVFPAGLLQIAGNLR